ncbi:hypothetical protein [Sphaerisporangium flaviroseum]
MARRRSAIILVGAAILAVVLGTGVAVTLILTGRDERAQRRWETGAAHPGGTPSGHPGQADPGYEDESSARSRESRARHGERTGAPPSANAPGDPRDGGLPPAPTRAEEDRATRLLLADPPLAKIVRKAYAEAAHRTLSSAADLRVRSLIFRRFGCETRRCLQLFVWFPNGEALDIGRIVVDMSSGGVRVLRW